MQSWIVIPARRGDKDKNVWKIMGHTLVEWILEQTNGLGMQRVITTDSQKVVAIVSRHADVIIVNRPAAIAEGKPGQLAKAVLHALDTAQAEPCDIVHLCQPTSPFVRAASIERADAALRDNPAIASAQTIVEIPHNFHELNQRYRFQEYVGFVHDDERRKAQTKLDKPARWAFGNLVSTRIAELRYAEWFFAQPSLAIPIDKYHALDVDTIGDVLIADAYVQHGLVSNPWGTTEYSI